TPSTTISTSRRQFLRQGTVLGATALLSNAAVVRAATNKNSRLRIFQIGTGNIGGMQRKGLEGHPMVEFAGFCDVDETTFKAVEKSHPGAWHITHYREAFANRVDQFD